MINQVPLLSMALSMFRCRYESESCNPYHFNLFATTVNNFSISFNYRLFRFNESENNLYTYSRCCWHSQKAQFQLFYVNILPGEATQIANRKSDEGIF